MINKAIAKQLKRPTGFLGKILSKFLKQMNSEIYVQVIKDVNAQDGDRIFEIGYGHGSGILQLVKIADCVVEGIDFSEVMYKDAVKLNQKYIDKGMVSLAFGEFLDYEMKSSYFDKVFCVNVIYFWDDLQVPFLRIKESLNENGTFFIYMDSLEDIKNSRFTNDEMFNLYDIDFVLKSLEDVGFQSSYYNYGRGHIIMAIRT